jgi:hypothetical protein
MSALVPNTKDLWHEPALRRAARFRIDHGGLTALLHQQGYRRDEFGE